MITYKKYLLEKFKYDYEEEQGECPDCGGTPGYGTCSACTHQGEDRILFEFIQEVPTSWWEKFYSHGYRLWGVVDGHICYIDQEGVVDYIEHCPDYSLIE
jgi:hypothetical protein